MVRKKGERRRTTKGNWHGADMEAAVTDVLQNGFSCRKAADKYNLAFKTVAR